ncbi:hypothetical protein E1298_26810 [Actinomadura rubrisoli]|uniref:Tn3 transposase DDE domain-containing protein n=1 Tax=Actinomadura rubrisoli TaxID=2530368 RepID=A0A4R5B1H3_9ACTN|nr:hypothetical protein E1298_26810 [Actinomadura rubrisoli]
MLRRLTRGGPKHPIGELGKAVKSVFAAEHVASQALRREIHEGLQVVENRHSANTDLFYGSAATIPGSDKEHQEVSMLSLILSRPFGQADRGDGTLWSGSRPANAVRTAARLTPCARARAAIEAPWLVNADRTSSSRAPVSAGRRQR